MSVYQKISEDEFKAILKLPPPEILVYMLRVAEISRRAPDLAPVISYRNIPKKAPTTLTREFGWLFCGLGTAPTSNLIDESAAIAGLKEFVPFLDDLNMAGNYCLAGSAPIVACLSGEYNLRCPGDADFYPVLDMTLRDKMTSQDNAMRGYTAYLKDMDTICDKTSLVGSKYPYMARTYTYRNRHCTTTAMKYNNADPEMIARGEALFPPPKCCTSFQIIHRGHTSPVSVVVGFDQVCCKAFYDGDQIYFTLDAALALYFRINPIDWRRESPSHMRRAQKYYDAYRFSPIFPGLDFNLGRDLSDNRQYYLARAKLVSTRNYNEPAPYIDINTDLRDPRLRLLINREDYDREDRQRVEYQESDYDSDGTTPEMALHYRCLSGAIKGQPEKMVVFAKRPLMIISQYETVNVKKILHRLITSEKSTFYTGSPRARAISKEMSRLTMRHDGYEGHLTLMSIESMMKFTALHAELTTIFDERCADLQRLVMTNTDHLTKVEFLVSNPGAQFTASFHPIIRRSPQDYFGSRYVHIDLTICKQSKLWCLWARNRSFLFRGWDLNLIKLLFFWIDRAVIYDPIEAELIGIAAKSNDLGVEIPDRPADGAKIVLNPLPWKEPKTPVAAVNRAVTEQNLAAILANNVGINQRPVEVPVQIKDLIDQFNTSGFNTDLDHYDGDESGENE